MLRDLVAVLAQEPKDNAKAMKLAKELSLPLLNTNSINYPYQLVVTPEKLILKKMQGKQAKAIFVDFLSAKLAYRRKNQRELLKKAMGSMNPKQSLIVDATAGLGEDAFILASKGYSVLMIERSAILAKLLEDGLTRFSKEKPYPTFGSLQLIHADAKTYLPKLAQSIAIDVVYLDPMFPERKKTALPRKEMEILRALIGQDTDAAELLQISLKVARRRVVVKRLCSASPLGELKPLFSISGKINRFDIYQGTKES